MSSGGARLCDWTTPGPDGKEMVPPGPSRWTMRPLEENPLPLMLDPMPWASRYEPRTRGPTRRMNMATYEHTMAPVGPLVIAEKRIDIEPMVTAVSAPSPATMTMSPQAMPPSNATTERMGSE